MTPPALAASAPAGVTTVAPAPSPASPDTGLPTPPERPVGRLVDEFQSGLDAPICLTWELTYACNLACVHCLSSSGRRDPRELSTAECTAVIDELQRMQVFYVNIGGGEPTVRKDFWELVDYATDHQVGVKFSTNGSRIDADVARRLASSDYVDVQISLDGATPEVNDPVRGPGTFDTAMTAMGHLRDAGFSGFKLSVVCTRHNIPQLDAFKAIADEYGAQLRLTRLRPSGRGADTWDELHPLPHQQRELYDWLVAHGDDVLTGDSFFHLAAYGDALPGLNLCGAGRVVCLIDPVGDVYACPFAIHDEFLAGNVRADGGFQGVWRESELFLELREPQAAGACNSCQFFDSCRGGCMAAKFFTGLPMDGPDPECVLGHGEELLKQRGDALLPKPSVDRSKRLSKRQRLERAAAERGITLPPQTGETPPPDLRAITHAPDRACDESPLAGFAVTPPDRRPNQACDERPSAALSVEGHDVPVVHPGAASSGTRRRAAS
ncbi:MAG: mycofactocin radical SAM maturase [Solirubrobacteraceae bacterium]